MSGAVLDRGLSLDLARGTLKTGLPFDELIRKELVVPVEGKNPPVHFIRPDDRTKAIELLLDMASKAPDTGMIRFAGGCNGFTADMNQALIDLVVGGIISTDGKRAFRGTVGSGATKEFNDDGTQKIMITQTPYIIARQTDCISWGSAPQTYTARQDVEKFGALITSKYGAYLDEHGHGNFLTQQDATTFQGWDGDVSMYMEAFEACKRHGYNTAIVTVNGGGVTKDEVLLALSKGIPVVLVEGSGRAADEFVKAARSEDPEAAFKALYEEAYTRGLLKAENDISPGKEELASLIKFAQLDSPGSLSHALDELGLLTEL